MRVKGDSQPLPYMIEPVIGRDGYATIRLTQNVQPYEEVRDETVINGYEYDEYLIDVPMYAGLDADIAANTAAWLTMAANAEADKLARDARERRDALLAACDYALNTDYPASDAERLGWQTYRQALRDMPEQEGFPRVIVWPMKPAREIGSSTVLGDVSALEADNIDLMEYTAQLDYRMCLTELGLTESELNGDENI